jgi:hypothetical protein
MKKVKSITDLFGNKLNVNEMDILFTGSDYVIAKYKGYGFVNTYAPFDGYTVEFE